MPPLSDRDHAPSEIVRRLDSLRAVAGAIQRGLKGTPFHWNGTEGDYNVMWAADLGLTLITKTQVEKRGYRLKRGARPVGSRYFGSPISKSASLYVLECQAVKKEQP